jgi:hypothetical protein
MIKRKNKSAVKKGCGCKPDYLCPAHAFQRVAGKNTGARIYESSGSVHSDLVREFLRVADVVNAEPERLVKHAIEARLVKHAIEAAFEAARLYSEGWRAK